MAGEDGEAKLTEERRTSLRLKPVTGLLNVMVTEAERVVKGLAPDTETVTVGRLASTRIPCQGDEAVVNKE